MLSVTVGLFTLCFPIAILGPIVALGSMKTVRSGRLWLLLVYFLILLASYIALFQLMALNWGHNFPGLGYEAYTRLPYIAVISGFSFLIIGRQNWKTRLNLKREKIQYTMGAVLIVIFQIFAQFLFQATSPFLLDEWTVCNWFMQLNLPCK